MGMRAQELGMVVLSEWVVDGNGKLQVKHYGKQANMSEGKRGAHNRQSLPPVLLVTR
jgi:hypothetical protein